MLITKIYGGPRITIGINYMEYTLKNKYDLGHKLDINRFVKRSTD